MPRTASFAFTANDAFDIGMDSYSPVSLAYFERAPFKFNGDIAKVHIDYLEVGHFRFSPPSWRLTLPAAAVSSWYPSRHRGRSLATNVITNGPSWHYDTVSIALLSSPPFVAGF